jgi:hypothetical protein
MTTPCRHCGKPFKNVLEHITKSHSWLQLTCEEDGEISDRCAEKEEFELFWKDHRFIADTIQDGKDACQMGFGSSTFEGYVWVSLARSTTHRTMWVVTNIETVRTVDAADGRTLRDIRKHYSRPNIQVLHQQYKPAALE